ncbi:MAG: nucleoside phosphorylase [Massiliimalia sp.]
MAILYDPNPKAVIEPCECVSPIKDFPALCISTFSRNIVETFAQEQNAPVIANLVSANGLFPVYQVCWNGITAAMYLSPVGAPAAAGMMEDMIAKGSRYFVFFGSCGVLDRSIDDGTIIVPTHAYRDEGTSYHYLPDSEELPLESAAINLVTESLSHLGFYSVAGKVWTTDAFYRETPDKMSLRKSQGCLAVEMECSALAAVAKFRGVHFAQFLYAADNLDNESWDRRSLGVNQGMDLRHRYLAVAFTCAHKMRQTLTKGNTACK